MARNFSELHDKMSTAQKKRARQMANTMLAEMPLHELRRAREMTQETLAEAMDKNQATVSQMERRADVYVSTLRRYIEAMGGELRIVAAFPDGDVMINQFRDASEMTDDNRKMPRGEDC